MYFKTTPVHKDLGDSAHDQNVANYFETQGLRVFDATKITADLVAMFPNAYIYWDDKHFSNQVRSSLKPPVGLSRRGKRVCYNVRPDVATGLQRDEPSPVEHAVRRQPCRGSYIV